MSYNVYSKSNTYLFDNTVKSITYTYYSKSNTYMFFRSQYLSDIVDIEVGIQLQTLYAWGKGFNVGTSQDEITASKSQRIVVMKDRTISDDFSSAIKSDTKWFFHPDNFPVVESGALKLINSGSTLIEVIAKLVCVFTDNFEFEITLSTNNNTSSISGIYLAKTPVPYTNKETVPCLGFVLNNGKYYTLKNNDALVEVANGDVPVTVKFSYTISNKTCIISYKFTNTWTALSPIVISDIANPINLILSHYGPQNSYVTFDNFNIISGKYRYK